ncbi:hypothetical protein ACFUMH_02045 [Cellulomonas sp. NPDC057328]|uniref:hypothetical protein n=1 Tax=Cellulomonas sp. NPDC057328 TaxID=3346101 RepID=UPI00362CA642
MSAAGPGGVPAPGLRVTQAELDALAEAWRARWPDALAAWGRASRMHPPVLHTSPVPGARSFAWYDTRRVEVHADLVHALALGVEDHALAVLAHEVGHHLLAPVDRRTGLRIAARVRAGLVDQDHLVGVVANLWCDLLVNDRLQRTGGADWAATWRALAPASDPLMALVLRADEMLWHQPRGSLTGPGVDVDEGAAWLCARLVRAYARDPVGGAAGFASLVRTALPEDALRDLDVRRLRLVVCGDADEGTGLPAGLAGDPSLAAPVLHPSLDPAVVGDVTGGATGTADEDVQPPVADASAPGSAHGTLGSTLLPGDLHAVLLALGDTTSLEDVAIAWYRDRAAAYLVPFPVERTPGVPEHLVGGYDTWEVGDDLADVDWTGTVTASPVVLPGVTTVRREVLDDAPALARETPVDLDLYLDSSGSMPDPKRFSAIALAGAVLALSALRVGARVQATTWSGPHQVAGTDGFTRDPEAVLRAVVAHFGGATAFPLGVLRRTYLGDDGRPPAATRPTHIAVVSDDGARTMLADASPDGDGPTPLAVQALERAGGGGSLLLDVPEGWRSRTEAGLPAGYDVHWVGADTDLVDFARDFARRTYARTPGPRSAGATGGSR